LVWALLFLKEDFSFFPPVCSSLYSRETSTETKKEDILTALVFLRSATIVKNTLWFPYSSGKRAHTKLTCSSQSQCTQLNPHSHIRQNLFGQQQSHYQP